MSFALPDDVRLAADADVPALRSLINAAYLELAERGLNFTGSYQDEELTRQRIQGAEVYLVERGGELLASVSLSIKPVEGQTDPCLYVNQLAVAPAHKRRGLGSFLLDLAERRAEHSGLRRLRLCTAVPAFHLVGLYRRLGYAVVEEIQIEGKTYRSYIMEKCL